MPTPLRPNDNGEKQAGYFDMTLEALQSSIFASPLAVRQAGIPDKVADALFEFWDKSSPVRGEGDDAEYKIPEGYPPEKILMLKTENLLFGKGNAVKLTEKARAAITLMILAEENSVKKNAVKKPYSVLFAESKLPKKSRLAFASVDLTGKTALGVSLVVKADSSTRPNAPFPADKMPTSRTGYVWSQRVTFSEGTFNKQYIVRVYEYDDGTYGVVAFNGRIGHGLAMQPKGLFGSRGAAWDVAVDVINSKIAKGYRRASDNNQAPGISAAEETRQTSGEQPISVPPRTRVRQAPAPRPRAPVPVPQLVPAKKPEPGYDVEKILREWKPSEIEDLTGEENDTPTVFS